MALATALAALAAIVPGCGINPNDINGGATAGLASYSYGGGELTSEVSDTLDRTHAAARAAAEETGVMIRESERRAGRASIEGVLPDGKSVKIKLRSVTPSQTEVKIHIGMWGSEGQSRVILDHLRYGLAVSP
jgi:hypothetical protein